MRCWICCISSNGLRLLVWCNEDNLVTRIGLSAQRVTGVTMESLSEATAKGHPVIVRMSLDRGGHAIVVDGVTIRNGQPVVTIRDPALGRQYFTPVSEFKQKFSGEVIFTNGSKNGKYF